MLLNLEDRPSLSSPRLLLRMPCEADAETICRLADDWQVARRLGRLPHPYRLDDALFFLETIVPRELVWIIQRSKNADILGVIGLTPREDIGKVELGYWLGQPFWGRGFATEAAEAVLDHAFGRACLPEVISGYFADNRGSARVLEKLGFQVVGQSKRFCMAQGAELPHVDLRLMRQDRTTRKRVASAAVTAREGG